MCTKICSYLSSYYCETMTGLLIASGLKGKCARAAKAALLTVRDIFSNVRNSLTEDIGEWIDNGGNSPYSLSASYSRNLQEILRDALPHARSRFLNQRSLILNRLKNIQRNKDKVFPKSFFGVNSKKPGPWLQVAEFIGRDSDHHREAAAKNNNQPFLT